jgi:hypothetical protein
MKSLILGFALLLLAGAAHGRAVNICVITDMQNLTLAEGPPASMTHAIGAVTWASTDDNCDVVIFGGDNVDGFYWEEDPWCLSQTGPGDPDCSEYYNSYLDFDCDTDGCGDANAQSCLYGNPGNFCEWDRAAYLVDIVRTANKPFIVVYGNHDNDKKGMIFNRCQRAGAVFNMYFGPAYMSDDFEESGYFEETTDCAGAPGGRAEQAIASYHVLNIDGMQILFLNFPWFPETYTGLYNESTYYGTTEGVVNYMHGIVARHKRKPTVALAHTMSAESCPDAAYEHYFPWCNNLSGWYNFWTGFTVRTEFLKKYPQFFMTIGGHIRDLAAAVGLVPWKVLAVAHDYTDPIAGAPAWQTNTDNGGGGVVTIYRVDPVSGVISSLGYSPTEDDYINLLDNAEGSAVHHHVGLCGESGRYDIPASVCAGSEITPMVVR